MGPTPRRGTSRASTATPEKAPDTTPADVQAAIDALEDDTALQGITSAYEGVVAVMRLVRGVAKRDRNDEQRFLFRGIDAVLNAVGPALRRAGIIPIPRVQERVTTQVATRAGRMMNHTLVRVTYDFRGPGGPDDVISAENIPGEAMDVGDKSVSKAMSVAFRTALIQLFALPTDEPDPDATCHEIGKQVTEDEVLKAFRDAVEGANAEGPAAVAAALIEVGNGYGPDVLGAVQVHDKEGTEMTADALLRKMIAWFERQAAAAAQAGQDPASQQDAVEGPIRDVHADEAPQTSVHPEPAQPEPAQPTPVESQPAQQAEQAPAEPSKPRSRDEETLARVRDEIAFQARVMGKPVHAFTRTLTARIRAGWEQMTVTHLRAAGEWMVGQRPDVVRALRATGNAAGATLYQGMPNRGPADPRILAQIEAGGLDEGAAAPQGARA
ncbi:MAG TPA: ERF family protein [Kineosporiaceae bacterium]|nr:ERF family protein [Kineosporiaceae bacterium]